MAVIGIAPACGGGSNNGPDFGEGTGGGPSGDGSQTDDDTPGEGTIAPGDEGTDGDDESADGGSGGPLLDVGAPDGDPACELTDDLNGRAPCDVQALAGSFDPELEWAWEGEPGATESVVTPLVINLTDDDDSGSIDLCDTPDIVVTAYESDGIVPWIGRLYVLDGATGAVHFAPEQPVSARVNAAAGDIDGDGLPEIVTAVAMPMHTGVLIAFEHDGTVKWTSNQEFDILQGAVALADLDADGDVEIMLRTHVHDHNGSHLWSAPGTKGWIHIPTAADLDGDGDLEVIHGSDAYHHDGTLYYSHPEVFPIATPQVADVDGDGQPEVLVVGDSGVSIIEHDGTLSTLDALADLTNYQPAAIHDIDGDGLPELTVGAANAYSVLEDNLTIKWTADIVDQSGYAAGTAFDFLGDGTAEAMYADETTLHVFDALGGTALTVDRASWTQAENPVVADIDNDGSAEIVVVSNKGYVNADQPAVQAFRDAEDRWVPARRIWNQHAYHVTNVREDGTIPDVQPKNWEYLNTFRTQSQILPSGAVCRPEG